MEHWDAIAAERLALADRLAGLSDDQWDTPSLCSAWTVRDVAAHLVAPHTPTALPRFAVAFAVALGNFDKANRALTAHQARRPTGDLVADLRRYATSHFTPPGFGSEAPLTDVMVHGCDMLIPLGIGDDHPAERWRPVLDLLVSPKARRGFVGRQLPPLRWVATDMDWAAGGGDEAEGPAWALALTILGRRAGPQELHGPGAAAARTWAAA